MDDTDVVEEAKSILRDQITIGNWWEGKDDFSGEIRVIWLSKVLKNWKAVLITDNDDELYYEITRKGEKNETYVDIYQKVHNVCIQGSGTSDLEEIDRNARAYGYEIGAGKSLTTTLEFSDNNPFLNPSWRDQVKDGD